MRTRGNRIFPFHPIFFILVTWTLFSVVSLPASASTTPANPAVRHTLPSPERIRVLLEETAEILSVRGFDLRLHDAHIRKNQVDPVLVELKQPSRQSEIKVRCSANRVILQAVGSQPARSVEVLKIDTPAGMFRFQSRFLRDSLWVFPAGDGARCQAINELEIEKYLDGLVNSEFSASWNESAIEAQVVAARTYALYQVKRARMLSARFDVHGSVKDQVYEGSHQEDPRSARAVDRTRGQILMSRNGPRAPIKAFYHSTCGGATELPQNVWGVKNDGFRRTVSCPYCASSPRIQWELSLRDEEVRDALARGASVQAPKSWPKNWRELLRRQTIRSVRMPASGGRTLAGSTLHRAERIRIELHSGVVLNLTGAQLRDWVGATRIRSTAFTVVRRSLPGLGGVFHFAGRGNGHGVGLCQWGAKVMGERGFDRTAILHFYYPDAIVAKLW